MRNPIELLKNAVDVVKGNAKTLLLLSFFGAILSEGYVVAIERIYNPVLWSWTYDAASSLISTFVFAITILIYIALTLAVIHPNKNVLSLLSESRKYFWRYIGASILVSLIILGGLILLIIPGIMFAVMYMFAAPIVLYENKSVIASLKQSKKLVHGHWWVTFGRIGVFMFIFIFISTLLQYLAGAYTSEAMMSQVTPWKVNVVDVLFGIIVVPVIVAYIYGMYQDLHKKHEAKD